MVLIRDYHSLNRKANHEEPHSLSTFWALGRFIKAVLTLQPQSFQRVFRPDLPLNNAFLWRCLVLSNKTQTNVFGVTMAHNQEPRHEEPLNQLYRQRLRPQYPSQQYHAQNHQNSVNNQSTEFSQWPQYELSQQSSDERSTSQDAIRQYAGRGQFIRGAHNSSRGYDRGGANDGQSGRNEGRSQNVYHGQNRTRNYSGEIRRLPAQQRPMDPERRAYVDPRARVPPRPADDSLNRGQVLKHPMPTEPGFDDDPVENPSSDYDKGTRYNDSQEYRLFPQPYQDDQGATVDPEKRFMVETEQQDYGKAYRKEISQGNSDYAQDYVYSDSAEPNLVSTHSQTQSRVDQKPQFHKPCEWSISEQT